MKRILLVKTSSLGDVIHNLPIVGDILQQHPDAEIDWVVEESFADIPRLHPAVKQIFPVAMRRWRKHLFSKTTWSEIGHFKQAVSNHPYDLIIDTQGLIKSAVLSQFAKGMRYGFDKQSAREPLASHLYQKTFQVSRNQHAVMRNRELAAYALGYPKPNNAPDYGIASIINKLDVDLPKKFIIGLHGTSKDSKLWPQAQWITLAKLLLANDCRLVLPWASETEYKRAINIANRMDNVIVLPKLTITQLAFIINHSIAAVGVDTGLSHLSAALNIPTIAIYTDTDPKLTGVAASSAGKVINLGGKKQNPSTSSVMNALKQINVVL
jgi:lipopolysaccharide heptosyltransferase I